MNDEIDNLEFSGGGLDLSKWDDLIGASQNDLTALTSQTDERFVIAADRISDLSQRIDRLWTTVLVLTAFLVVLGVTCAILIAVR